MARIKPRWLFSRNGRRTLASGRSLAPFAWLLVLAPVICCDGQCEIRWLCAGLSVVAAAGLYVLLGVIRELHLLGERLVF